MGVASAMPFNLEVFTMVRWFTAEESRRLKKIYFEVVLPWSRVDDDSDTQILFKRNENVKNIQK